MYSSSSLNQDILSKIMYTRFQKQRYIYTQNNRSSRWNFNSILIPQINRINFFSNPKVIACARCNLFSVKNLEKKCFPLVRRFRRYPYQILPHITKSYMIYKCISIIWHTYTIKAYQPTSDLTFRCHKTQLHDNLIKRGLIQQFP